jgi:hypothetical protein
VRAAASTQSGRSRGLLFRISFKAHSHRVAGGRSSFVPAAAIDQLVFVENTDLYRIDVT